VSISQYTPRQGSIKIKEQQLGESVVVGTCVGLLGVVWTNITHRRTPPDMTK